MPPISFLFRPPPLTFFLLSLFLDRPTFVNWFDANLRHPMGFFFLFSFSFFVFCPLFRSWYEVPSRERMTWNAAASCAAHKGKGHQLYQTPNDSKFQDKPNPATTHYFPAPMTASTTVKFYAVRCWNGADTNIEGSSLPYSALLPLCVSWMDRAQGEGGIFTSM